MSTLLLQARQGTACEVSFNLPQASQGRDSHVSILTLQGPQSLAQNGLITKQGGGPIFEIATQLFVNATRPRLQLFSRGLQVVDGRSHIQQMPRLPVNQGKAVIDLANNLVKGIKLLHFFGGAVVELLPLVQMLVVQHK